MQQNILLLSNAYFPSIGGIENSLRHLAQEALNNGHRVKIVVSDIGVDENYKRKEYDIIDDVKVERYPLRPIKIKWLGVVNLFYSNLILYRKLKRIKVQEPNTIVIARFHFCALIAHFAGFENIRYVVPSIVENQLSVEDKLKGVNKIKRYFRVKLNNIVQKTVLIKSCNYVFSRTMLEQCVKLAGNSIDKYVITKPGVDSTRFYPLKPDMKLAIKSQLGIPKDKPIILFVGRFVKAKGADLLLKALSKVDIDCHLVMVGEGEEEYEYKKLIEQLKIRERVSIFPPTRKVELYYQTSDVFAMTSNYEPLGQTILEAFSSGLHLLAFRNSKDVDTATEELGFDEFVTYAKKYSVDELQVALKYALETRELFSPELVSKKAQDKFNWEELLTTLIKTSKERA